MVPEYSRGFTFFHLGLLLFVSPSLSAFEVPFLAFVATERKKNASLTQGSYFIVNAK